MMGLAHVLQLVMGMEYPRIFLEKKVLLPSGEAIILGRVNMDMTLVMFTDKNRSKS